MDEHDRIFLAAAIFLAQTEKIRGGPGRDRLTEGSPTAKDSRRVMGRAIKWAASLENEVKDWRAALDKAKAGDEKTPSE
jgi:hypothetical protein